LTRRRIAFLQDLAADLRDSLRRRRSRDARAEPDAPVPDELERRLDETRERLRREIPPRADDPTA
jgi:hypothetical protein